MKAACVREIADLAKSRHQRRGCDRLRGPELRFGPDYLIPKPFDSRLILRIAPAVALAAEASGVATRPIKDIEAYRQSLDAASSRTPACSCDRCSLPRVPRRKRVAYAEGEEERVLRAVQIALDERLAKPILIGRPAVIAARIERAGLRMQAGLDFELVNPEDDARFRQYWEAYHRLDARAGVTPEMAKAAVRRSNTTIAALMVHLGDADGMLCGLVGRFDSHLEHVQEVIGPRGGEQVFATLNALMLPKHTLFIADTYVNDDPSAEQLADIAEMAAEDVRRFGLEPRVAFLSHSAFGSSKRPSALKMRAARDLFVETRARRGGRRRNAWRCSLRAGLRDSLLPDSTLTGSANLLVLPNLDAANILFNVLKMTGGQGVTVGPILLGVRAAAHILTPSATVRRIVNMTAFTVAHAGRLAGRQAD